MKRILTLALVFLMLAGLVACGHSDSGNNSTTPPSNSTGDNQPSGTETENGNASQNGENAEAAKLTGRLNLIDLDDRDPSVLRGVTISGNCAGTAEGFTAKSLPLPTSAASLN